MNMGIVAGLIKALAPGVDPQVIEQAVTDWLDDHPEATTTVEDGSITEAKLAQDVLADLAEVEELKEAIMTKAEEKTSSATGVDLDVADDDGNVLVRMAKGHIQTKNFNSAKVGAKVITLKPSGGDFSTLSAALASITDADSETNPYEIHVYPGTYNTLEGYTEEQILSADIGGGYTDDSFVGAKLTDGISLIGIGDPTQIILTATLDSTYSSAVRGNISTLNTQGTCSVKNVTIRAQRIRYCVHDDFGSTKHYTRIVENCIFEGLGTSLSYNPAVTWGAGIANPGITAIFRNCDFGYKVGYHTRQLMTGNSLLIFENCRGLALRIGDQANEADTAHHTFIVSGCDFDSVQISRPNATTPHISVMGANNKDAMMFMPTADNPLIAGIMKTKASSVAIGTLVNVSAGEMTDGSSGITAVAASGIDSALGVLVFRDSLYDYIQTDGYINAKRLSLSGLSVGDYITVDSSMKLTATSATASNAVGVVKYTDTDGNAQIMLRRF